MRDYTWTRPRAADLAALLDANPSATVIAHPEIRDVVELAFADERRLRLEAHKGRLLYSLGTPVVQES